MAASSRVGLVRIDLSFYDRCRTGGNFWIRKLPLGDVLIQANVLRRIEPKWYYRFAGDSPVHAGFGEPKPKAAYGRLGTIYCDERPAIELLEIVYDDRVKEG
jgi:hypothetical protein